MARIRHIALVVKDLEQTADFYQKALGLSRSEMSEGPTARRIYMSDGEVNLALRSSRGDLPGNPAVSRLFFPRVASKNLIKVSPSVQHADKTSFVTR
jgi:catechol 2,3-dioxygenase-like lactoylglutathione lyase family enzyme